MKLFFATEPVPLKSVIVFPHGKKTKKTPKQWMIYGLLRSSDCTERCHGIPAAANARSCSALRSPRWHPPDGGGCSCDLRGQSFWNPTVQTTTTTLVPSRRGPARSPGNSLLQNKKKQTKKKKDLALKELDWPWIMKYLLSSFQVKHSGNLRVASDLCDSWMVWKLER